MTDESANGTRIDEEKRIAHTGALARWAGHCARHPWRVVGTWLVVFVSLIALNVAFHGTLVNDFKVPGTDFQKATDLINAKFGGQKGAALRVVVAAPEGQRLNSAEAQAAVDKMLAASKQSQTSLDDGQVGRQRHHQPALAGGLAPAVQGRPDRVLRRAVRPDRLRAAALGHRRSRGPAARDRRAGRPAGRVHRRGRERAARPRASATSSA